NKPGSFWSDLFYYLEAVRPNANRVHVKPRQTPEWDSQNWRPDVSDARLDLIDMTKKDLRKFRNSHASYVQSAIPALAPRIPFVPFTSGVVTTAGAHNFGQVISMLLMLRYTNSTLPVQIMLDTTADWIDELCADLSGPIARLNATCIPLRDAWTDPAPGSSPPPWQLKSGYQWKIMSIMASSFQSILFLDADALPILNPDGILAPGSQPFLSTGLITWPDFWTSTISKHFYAIAGPTPSGLGITPPPLTSRTSSESGIIAIDKARHADTILLAAYYNYHGPGAYYPLLTQHSHGEGDKETLLQAALVLEALASKGAYKPPTDWIVALKKKAATSSSEETTAKTIATTKKGYYDVKALPRVHGQSARDIGWRGMFMQQMDPMEDYRAVMAALETERQKSGAEEGFLPTDAHYTDSRFLAATGNLSISQDVGRYMFWHHNGVKLNFMRVGEKSAEITAVDEKGRLIRLWGDPEWIIRYTGGRDVEMDLWRDSMEIWCRHTDFKGVCERMREVWEEVY
ncbi:mannosyltransferase putative-domain-containing protein, partial [Bombardia bombarda]